MAILNPDKIMNWNGLKVNEYLLTNHNPNNIAMPSYALPAKPLGVTVHNTGAISVASGTTMAEQYTRATVNGNMNDVRVHFYVDDYCAWQNLPLTLSGWHAADGGGNGNRKTIAIEVAGNSAKAEANAAKLVAYLLQKYDLNVQDNLFTHTHWLNVRDGIRGDNDYLNTRKHPYKWCPIYILPHWGDFKNAVQAELNKLKNNKPNNPNTTQILYRVRKSWADSKSQIGAFSSLENAKVSCKDGYKVFDDKGNIVYPVTQTTNQPKPIPQTTPTKVNVKYRAYSANKWWSEITNYNDINENGYAGVENSPIRGLAIKADAGKLKYRVHIKGGGWLGWMEQYDINNWRTGCAGNKVGNIDAVQISLENLADYKVRYRVSTIASKSYLSWIEDFNTKDSMGYAGILGQAIDKIQIEIIKK